MSGVDRRALLGTLAVGAATAAVAQPAIKPLSDLKKEADAACVYHVDYGDPPRFVQTLTNISNHYSAYGANPFDLQIALVAHGPGVKFFLENLENTPWKEDVMVPQIFERVESVSKQGLKIYLCNITFERQKIDRDKARKRDFISFVPSGVATVAALQTKGFAYIKIG